ncbi:hypothetical protein C8R44DRAFT_753103 [Mycena epipterygia]|nr:hypothetical protein C8R44DRAFT_753103 [Mycena epipterygia]
MPHLAHCKCGTQGPCAAHLQHISAKCDTVSTIGKANTGGYQFSDHSETALGISYAVLSKVWKAFDFNGSRSPETAMPWLYCISSVLLRSRYGVYNVTITVGFTVIFSGAVHESLMYAAQGARQSFTEDDIPESKDALEDITCILEGIVRKMPITPADLEQNRECWRALRNEFDEKINTLKESLQSMSASGVTTACETIVEYEDNETVLGQYREASVSRGIFAASGVCVSIRSQPRVWDNER